jgi:2,5-diamino-6-(ribosylamino)-4(3H)-pyrimidinone 5'-phosphate reductase
MEIILPKIIVHNSMSIDGSLVDFDVNMALHYQIAGCFDPDLHLVGSNTAKKGIKIFLQEIPKETKNDFRKPVKNGLFWAIPDTSGKLKNLLHIFRQSEYCKDAIIFISKKTPKDYIEYLKERNYDHYVVGEDKCNLTQLLELLKQKYHANTILTDTGRVLSNLLIKNGLVSKISLLIHPVIVGRKAYNMFSNIENRFEVELIKKECFKKGYCWITYKIEKPKINPK